MSGPATVELDDWQAAVVACGIAARMLGQHDIARLIAQGERALDIGPLLDPTLYREKGQALREDIEALRAALPLAKFGTKLGEPRETTVGADAEAET